MLDPLTGYQARGVLSPGFQPTSAPQRTTGADLSQFVTPTTVPQDTVGAGVGVPANRGELDLASYFGVPAQALSQTMYPIRFVHGMPQTPNSEARAQREQMLQQAWRDAHPYLSGTPQVRTMVAQQPGRELSYYLSQILQAR